MSAALCGIVCVPVAVWMCEQAWQKQRRDGRVGEEKASIAEEECRALSPHVADIMSSFVSGLGSASGLVRVKGS